MGFATRVEMRSPGRRTVWTLVFLVLGTASLFSAMPARAWGPEGHEIVAEIAQSRLSVHALVVLNKEFSITRLSDVANWADRIKGKRKETRPWHYTNIPEGESQYKKERDCPDGACVTEKIKEFESRIPDKARSRRERQEAVMFLIHFIADVHQPLHLGNPGDRGGNNISIEVPGEKTNLHAVWDHGLIDRGDRSLLKYAAGLSREIIPAEASGWTESGVVEWSGESRKLAMEVGYRLERDKDGRLTQEYLNRARQVVRQQLKKAGVRLAHRLNLVLK